VILVLTPAIPWGCWAWAGSPEEIEQKLKVLQEQVNDLKQQLDQSKTQAPALPTAVQPVAQVTTVPAAPPLVARPSWLSDFKLGGYGSTRFEANDLNKFSDSFTFRRFVLTGDATIGERLRSYVELEFERLTELEVERCQPVEAGLRGFSQSIEGSSGSEISLEQAWMQFTLADWLRFRAGMILVPLGRFNINHDDNRWDLPRRSLVDRGVSVLPVKSAWSEVGMGFTGDIPTERFGKFSYQVYVMNGVILDSSLETFARASSELETEVEIQLCPRYRQSRLQARQGRRVPAGLESHPRERDRRLLLRHPAGGFVGEFSLGSRACSTSATFGQTLRAGSRRVGHVLDPRTGRPVRSAALVTVLARSAAVAEAASTALLVLGRSAVDAMARRLNIDACWVDRSGVYTTPRFPL